MSISFSPLTKQGNHIILKCAYQNPVNLAVDAQQGVGTAMEALGQCSGLVPWITDFSQATINLSEVVAGLAAGREILKTDRLKFCMISVTSPEVEIGVKAITQQQYGGQEVAAMVSSMAEADAWAEKEIAIFEKTPAKN